MIISKTPFRVSLFGGGTDWPQYYRKKGGAVMGFALNRYCYVSARHLPPFFEYKHRIVYSKIETANMISEIEHPAVRCAINAAIPIDDKGLEIHHDGDLPARSGLGSSSAFMVGILHALHALSKRRKTKAELAKQAIMLEQDVLQENVGSQDQVWAAYGGMNYISFQRDDTFQVSNLTFDRALEKELTDNLLLVFTGFSRYASKIEGEKMDLVKVNESNLDAIAQITEQAVSAMSNGNVDALGKLLHETWLLKRALSSNVSNSKIDELYQVGRDAGALGGKLLGAGGGGFMLFYVHPRRHHTLIRATNGLITLPVGVDRDGSRIVVYEPQS